jgi:hypothetical protein
MATPCFVCIHEKRDEIDRALVDGVVSLPAMAGLYDVSEDCLFRHKKNHLPEVLIQAKNAVDMVRADSLLDQVKNLQDKALGILDKAEDAGDLRTAVSAIREARGNIELLAKLTSLLPTAPVTNILITSPEWLSTRTKILYALDSYPDAKLAVAEALRDQ